MYAFLGSNFNYSTIDVQQIENLKSSIQTNFQISPLLLIVPLITIVLAIKKTKGK